MMKTSASFSTTLSRLFLFTSLVFLLNTRVLFSSTIYVRASATGAANGSSWINAFPELQSALALAVAGDEIWVASGIYRPDFVVATGQHTHAQNLAFRIVDGVALLGGFAGSETSRNQCTGLFAETILDGDLSGNDGPEFTNYTDNAYHVVVAMDILDSATVLDGFKIRGGYAGGTAIYDQRAGGMYVIRAVPNIKNCIFAENWAISGPAGEGGGLHIVSSGQTIVDSCFFTGNRASKGGGLYIRFDSTPIIRNCLFEGNTSGNGAGAVSFVSYPQFIDCRFRNNSATVYGGGVMVSGGSVMLEDCGFTSNSADQGGGLWTNGYSVFLQRCQFESNRAGAYGGGVMQYCINCTSDITMVNCLLHNNTPEAFMNFDLKPESPPTRLIGCTFVSNEQGFWNGNSFPVQLVNSIFWNNGDYQESAQIGGFGAPAISVSHCNVQGWTGALGGDANSGLDPQFREPGLDAYHLSQSSPCIDVGDSNYVLLQGPTDIDGESRVHDGNDDGKAAIDIGVDEFGVISHMRGDPNADGSVDISDAVYIISYIFGGGPAPMPLESGDADNDLSVDIFDAVYLIQHIFDGGSAPCEEE